MININLQSIWADAVSAVLVVGVLLLIAAVCKWLVSLAAKKSAGDTAVTAAAPAAPDVPQSAVPVQEALKLVDVEEKIAAIIMAIVSDESGIPLSELSFRSIKRLQ